MSDRPPISPRAAVACAAAIVRARPRMILLFLAVYLGVSLLRYWIGATGGDDTAALVRAAAWVFTIVQVFCSLWMHVAALRLAADQRVTLRAAFRIRASQAVWFHGVALASVLTFLIRLWLGRYAGGVFAPPSHGLPTASVLGLAVGLGSTYLIFLPLQPGLARVMLAERATTLRQSLAGVRGRLLPAFATLMLMGYPLALARMLVFSRLRGGGAWTFAATALIDSILSVVMMLLTTAVYLSVYRRARDRMEQAAERPIVHAG